ncbi:MAG: GIY-YIG nuclease family protein [Rickettsiales bacterium]|nr:GIY-YIG nuclease family protein [Pseudomonadota bacterium]MDA0965750.1 GIY-YIG nuclease family protein [Pseudomonadota bacterium]MDG4543788.1 GIY-YIG nuclease family protein [Rickettsiales bacterium]MDG4545935.1 GIY-YIG nuclease family protein [Rickettsiales bacterium]MDG4548181.1 GIY-YIG nuclease family protein [Rickettsiales bacterium]
MNSKNYYVYILTNKKEGVFYTGVTSNLVKRVYEHKNNVVEGFTKKYNTKTLVYYEVFEEVEVAINREKRLKRRSRDWKIKVIEQMNPTWEDLYTKIT